MLNTLSVCLVALSLFCSTNLSWARQVPKECNKGPSYWCENLRQGADCGAVQHCIATVWEKQNETITTNEVSGKIVHVFKELKDVKDLINAEYLQTRVASACHDLPVAAARTMCKQNSESLGEYFLHVLHSDTTPETMCRIIGMCNSLKLNNIIDLNKKKPIVALKPEKTKVSGKLVGTSKCTWGPSYWCSNFSTGHECKATKHCVERVWPNLQVPEDNDSVCQICLDMVKQARDQLESNETQEELKEVFEGSCKLIPIKIVTKECIKLADDFVPELVETLASQMNPTQVCSVAGLCNNAKIDKLLESYNARLKLREGCNNCHKTVGVMRKRFDSSSYDDFLIGLLKTCGKMGGSFSDSCSMLIFKYYENILEAVKKDLTPKSLCHLSGQCSFQYHEHDEFTFPVVKFEELKATDDVPCEFCEQLVVHLRDMLTANTTELEFEKVLRALCKQTGEFKEECLHLVDEYYKSIYSFLMVDLKPDKICELMGLCGKKEDVPVAPLIPAELAVKITPSSKLIGAEETKIAHIPMKQENVRIVVEDASVAPLPIERMFVNLPTNPEDGKVICQFCQYFLHYLQVEISDIKNEEKIKETVEKACDKLPQSINDQCKVFVSQYGQQVIALLVHEIDPSSVCPALGLCPQVHEVRRVSINSDKSNCPLCLFAVEQLETMLKTNRTEASIRKALDGLCNHLSQKLRTQCVDFVDTYTEQLVEMLVANMNAQEICVFLKLCVDEGTDPLKLKHSNIDKYHDKPALRGDRNNHKQSLLPKQLLVGPDGDIETNEIPDNTVNGRPVKPDVSQKTICVICEFVLKEIDDEIKDKHNEDEIKKVVHGVCKRMPKSVRQECDQFVEKYADIVISLLAQELEPDEVCREMKLCDSTGGYNAAREEILDCAVCETVVLAVKKVLSNDKVDHDIVHIVEKSCGLLPAKYSARCHTMMEIYGDSVIHLIEQYGTKVVCQKIGLCSDRSSAAFLHMSKN
ncbi:uncharacterized protein LOC113226815 [Hyposmocoma kahamanoa]|uniref:uncharacterized protein LOC113226815 n=1 Tax=Hyposmocoma kahamanoa TaxID=1477025 RepID=UPI000E6D842B|nr:uncharacterized protein LOC113226815 [Hyposmocoma kahamanoa]